MDMIRQALRESEHNEALRLLASCGIGRTGMSDTLYVAKKGDEIIGCAGISVVDRVGWLCNVAVERPYRRRGLGARLVRSCVSWADDQGLDVIWLETMFWNTRFYEGLGFTPFRKENVPDHIMKLRVTPRCRMMAMALRAETSA